MSALKTMRAGYEQILQGAGEYYASLVQELVEPALGDSRRAALTTSLHRVTELIEIVESAVEDRLRRLDEADSG